MTYLKTVSIVFILSFTTLSWVKADNEQMLFLFESVSSKKTLAVGVAPNGPSGATVLTPNGSYHYVTKNYSSGREQYEFILWDSITSYRIDTKFFYISPSNRGGVFYIEFDETGFLQIWYDDYGPDPSGDLFWRREE